MEVSEIIKDVSRIFGDEAQVQLQRDDIIRWINDGQLDILKRTECILRTQARPPVEIVSGQPNYELADDFFKFKAVLYDGQRLLRTTSANINEAINQQSPFPEGQPTHYFWKVGTPSSIWLYPAPDTPANLSVEYVARPALIVNEDDPIEIPIELHALLKRYCMSQAYKMDDNLQGARAEEVSFGQEVNSTISDIANPEADSYPEVRPTGDDLW